MPSLSRPFATLLFPLLLAASAALAQTAPLSYPPTRQVDQVDVLHGVRVADPYRWLENTDSPETGAWIEAQNALTFGWLGAIPERPRIQARLTELWNYARYGLPFKEGGRYFWLENSGLQNQSVLYIQPAAAAKARVLLDPNTLSADGTVALTSAVPSENGRLLAYGVARSGSDWNEIRVRNVETGRDLVDTVRWVKFSDVSWTKDNRGFFYSRYAEPDAGNPLLNANKFHKLFYHRVGTRQSADELVYDRSDQPDWRFNGEVSDDGQYLAIYVREGSAGSNRLYFKDLASAGRPRINAPVVRLIDRPDASYEFVGNNGTEFVLRTNKGAPKERLIGVDIDNPREENWRTLIPETSDLLQSAAFVGDRLVARYLQDARASIRFYSVPDETLRGAGRPQGAGGARSGGTTGTISGGARGGPYRLERELQLPGPGMASFSGERGDRELFYSFTSYLYPATIFRYDIRSGQTSTFRAPPVNFDPSLYETKQVFYQSKDGTRVPMFITARKGIALDGNNPTILHGYGGFNISQTPGFSIANLLWLEMGGIYAVANIRGGGEYGREWYEAGTLARKQNVFDDFIAAAEYLQRERYTSPQKLAISGGSNGGLLVGAVLNQRPELFGAALPAVGVMDMLRFHKFTIGRAWTSDYGSPDNAVEFPALHAYSPLHNIRRGARYPATLITTADHDDRVVPGHSFKYAAALQAAQAGPAPILIRIETKAGHGAGKPTSKQIEEAADRLAFLVRALGMTPRLP
ncbi:MAG TPA: prolyl oligopeptidase family serine peptidase [Gemmatimonadaceae bacterium]|nr:prolyl oligopeptidase family serine peptidase [Gemmatimonadaceae bacterium]